MPERMLYIARHGEAGDDGNLTDIGEAQARALGIRMAGTGITAIHHGPLPRVARTAALVAEAVPAPIEVHETEIAGDYPPSSPDMSRLPAAYGRLVTQYDPAERTAGADLAARAVERFLAPPAADVRELVVTHNFLAGWLVRAALDGPDWRWLGLNLGNAALAVIQVRDGQPPMLVAFNDQSHLPEDLRWTGFPADGRP